MATIVYLDVEDEITTAASRIRQAAEPRVGLVLPFGSRVATSRINFRLLAREAMDNGKRLDIVAPDASARALAASAGLPVFGSVAEYENAIDTATGDDLADTANWTAAGGAAAAGAGAGLAAGGLSQGAAAAGTGAAGAGSGARSGTGPRSVMQARPAGAAGDDAGITADRAGFGAAAGTQRRRIPRGLIAGLLLLVVAVGAAAIAGYVLLPAADITVIPHIDPVGPISFTVRADPDVATVDVDAGVIPAQTLTIPVESQGEFPATGKRVEQTPAAGGVRWTNCDPTASYQVPSGTTVKTADGTSFTTDEALFLPVAALSGTPPNVKVKCSTSEVSITAIKPGPDGNVGAGAIRVVPPRYNRTVISVTNPSATSGGTRTEFTRIRQEDVDAAVEQLSKDLQAKFATEVENPSRVPPGTTSFPDTAVLGDPVLPVDPATLVGQEVDSFTLRMTAEGTVLAVDPAPVESIARARLAEDVSPDHQLVDGSTVVNVGDGSVTGGVVTFPVSGSAKQARPVDATALEAQVLGLPEADARAVLAPYGDVTITLWPGWVASVPTFEQRVTFTVGEPVDTSPGAAPSAPASEPSSTRQPHRGPRRTRHPRRPQGRPRARPGASRYHPADESHPGYRSRRTADRPRDRGRGHRHRQPPGHDQSRSHARRRRQCDRPPVRHQRRTGACRRAAGRRERRRRIDGRRSPRLGEPGCPGPGAAGLAARRAPVVV